MYNGIEDEFIQWNDSTIFWQGAKAYGGGVLGFQETLFDSKTISKITCLNKYTSINILAIVMPT